MKRCKRWMGLLLAALLLLTALPVTAFAKEYDEPCPLIYIHGFMAATIYADRNDPSSEKLYMMDTDVIMSAVKEGLPGVLGALALQDWTKFGERAADVATEILSPTYLGEDGEVHDSSGVYFVYPAASAIKKSSVLDFDYDWRRDPMEVAADLDAFINYVCESSGASQVNLIAHSLGGVVALSYVTLYGCEKVRGICFNASAVYGETYTGELMRGELSVTPASLREYLRFLADDNDYKTLLNGLVTTAQNLGLINFVSWLGNDFIKKEQEILSAEVLLPMFTRWLSIWSMVPDEYMDEALDFVFNKMYAGEDHSALREKVETYNTTVRAHREETLRALNEHSNVYVISRYGYPSFPLTSSYSNLGDGVVDTKYSSFGATTSLYNEQLPAEYRAAVPEGFLSPDGSVDASTCLFPEQTWFIRNLKHFHTPTAIHNFMRTLLNHEGQATVDTFEAYPRFLRYDAKAGTLTPEVPQPAPTFAVRFRAAMEELKALFQSLFEKISKKN